MNKKVKKLIAAFLVANSIVNYLPNHFAFADMSANEKRLVCQLEEVRHTSGYSIDWEKLSNEFKDENTTVDFKLYCLSLAFKYKNEVWIKEFSEILSKGRELFASPFLSMVLYRMESNGYENEVREFIPDQNDLFKYIESELIRFIKTPSNDGFDCKCMLSLLRYMYVSDCKIDKIRPLLVELSHKECVSLKILSLLSSINVSLDDEALSNARRSVNLIKSKTKLERLDIENLIALGKIHHETNEQLEALEVVINSFGGNKTAAEIEQGREVLIALGKIPHDTDNQLKTLKAVITHFGSNEAAAREDQGRKALIALGKIPRDETDERLEVLEAVINYFDNRNTLTTNPLSVMERAARNRQGKEALMALRNVLTHCSDNSKKYLLKAIDQVVPNDTLPLR